MESFSDAIQATTTAIAYAYNALSKVVMLNDETITTSIILYVKNLNDALKYYPDLQRSMEELLHEP